MSVLYYLWTIFCLNERIVQVMNICQPHVLELKSHFFGVLKYSTYFIKYRFCISKEADKSLDYTDKMS